MRKEIVLAIIVAVAVVSFLLGRLSVVPPPAPAPKAVERPTTPAPKAGTSSAAKGITTPRPAGQPAVRTPAAPGPTSAQGSLLETAPRRGAEHPLVVIVEASDFQ